MPRCPSRRRRSRCTPDRQGATSHRTVAAPPAFRGGSVVARLVLFFVVGWRDRCHLPPSPGLRGVLAPLARTGLPSTGPTCSGPPWRAGGRVCCGGGRFWPRIGDRPSRRTRWSLRQTLPGRRPGESFVGKPGGRPHREQVRAPSPCPVPRGCHDCQDRRSRFSVRRCPLVRPGGSGPGRTAGRSVRTPSPGRRGRRGDPRRRAPLPRSRPGAPGCRPGAAG